MQPIRDSVPGTYRRGMAGFMTAVVCLAVMAASMAVGGAVGGAAAQAQDQTIRFFRIGTGTTGGTYFPIGGLIANAISGPPGAPPCELGGSCGVPGLIAVAQASSGSVENINNIRDGLIESALAQADVATWAYRGSNLYEDQGPFPDLRAIAHLYGELVHVVVPADSPIETVADLRGKRVSIGEEGSGTLIDARLVLDAYDLSEDDIEAVHLRPETASDALLAGEIDAFMFVGGAPLLAIEDLARRMPIRLVPFDDPAARRLIESRPFFTAAGLPAETYSGVGAVPMIAVGALWVTSTAVDEETVYGITRALWHPSTQAVLENNHPRGSEIQVENALRGIGIPIHPGALRFYHEIGLMVRSPTDDQGDAGIGSGAGAAGHGPTPRATGAVPEAGAEASRPTIAPRFLPLVTEPE